MISVMSERDCCGCAACAAACPKQCITMTEGSLGHLFPSADAEICIHCGLCDSVCPISNPSKKIYFHQEVYAAYSQLPSIRFRGSSGGMFETFARHLIRDGYVVYGAAFDESLRLRCARAKSESELVPLTKSKYLQCDFSEKYSEIQALLNSGKKIFVAATPCQIAALNNFLGKPYSNLLTMDFFCHGVPSQRFFDDCIRYEEKNKYRGTITEYTFRKKVKNGSTPHYFSLVYRKGGRIRQKTGYYFDSIFYAFFQQYISLRESCYDCPFAGKSRPSDITVGDFHEIDRYFPGINRFEGISVVVVNTELGKSLLNACSDSLFLHQMNPEQLLADGTCFGGGSQRPAQRDAFVKDYLTMDIGALERKYTSKTRHTALRCYYSLPRFIRDRIKKLIGV